MKNNIFNILMAGGVALALTSCDGKMDFPTGGDGTLALGAMEVRNDDAVKLVKNDLSRAASDEELKDYKVNIFKKGETTPLYTYTYSEMPEVQPLGVGSYTVSVKSHDVQKAEWEKPYFIGSQDFDIESGKITDVKEVICKFSSIKVTIDYTDDLRSMLTEATVNVKANDEGELNYTLGETRAGYFEALEGSSTIIVTFNGVVNGTALTSSINIVDAAAGQHRIITFGAKNIPDVPEQTGDIDLGGITLDASMVTEDIDGNQTVEEDLILDQKRPWGEDPETPEKPDDPKPPVGGDDDVITLKPSNDNINLDGVNSADLGEYLLNIHAENGIENLQIDITSTNQGFLDSAGELLPLSFDMAHLDDETYENLSSIGLEGNAAVLGKIDVPFNITELVPLLSSFSGTHTFKIEVTDTKGNKLAKSLVILVP